MRKVLAVASAVVLFGTASMAHSYVGFSINVGGPPIVVSQPPDFLYPPELGFGVAVGVPYDMFYLDDIYYIYRGGGWYSTPYYGGDWRRMRPRELPPELRRYNLRRIHAFRDREYRGYARDRDHYRGRYFRPEGRGREEHHEMRGQGREERHDEHGDMRAQRHDDHRDDHRDMRDQHPDEHRDMHEQRPDEHGGDRREERH
jgi:hypothetical protein